MSQTALEEGANEVEFEGKAPPATAWSRSTRRVMVGEVPVSNATAWSCLASVMSIPLIWSDSQTPEDQRGPICPEHIVLSLCYVLWAL